METGLKLIIFFVMVALIGAVLALPTEWLWNDLMPALFGLKSITFRQALEMNLLAALLFKSASASSK
jgi:hypothetical protein